MHVLRPHVRDNQPSASRRKRCGWPVPMNRIVAGWSDDNPYALRSQYKRKTDSKAAKNSPRRRKPQGPQAPSPCGRVQSVKILNPYGLADGNDGDFKELARDRVAGREFDSQDLRRFIRFDPNIEIHARHLID